MVGVLILTHGGLAKELLSAARTISGDLNDFEALALDWVDSLEEVERKVGDALGRLDQGEGVLVLTDVFGGTPSNVAMRLKGIHKLEAVSGVNLPMVLRLGCLMSTNGGASEMTLPALAEWIQAKGQASICCSNGPSP